jgi:hypothetical protein
MTNYNNIKKLWFQLYLFSHELSRLITRPNRQKYNENPEKPVKPSPNQGIYCLFFSHFLGRQDTKNARNYLFFKDYSEHPAQWLSRAPKQLITHCEGRQEGRPHHEFPQSPNRDVHLASNRSRREFLD